MTTEPRFLIARLSALGDTVCSLPAAVALKRAFPNCHITWAVDPRFAGIVECCTAVDEVVRVKGAQRLPGRFDAALDLQGLLKSGIIVGLARAKTKVGYHWQREGSALFSARVLPDPTSFHVVDQYVDVARAVGGELDRAEFALTPKQDDTLSVRRKLKEREVYGRFVLMNAGAGWATKRWQPEKFAALIDRIHTTYGLRTVLLGGRSDSDHQVAAETIAGCKVATPASLVGETGVRELVALVRLASLHVGGDTGSTHLAAALDIPAVGLYGLTRPQRTCPYGQVERCHHDERGIGFIEVDPVWQTVQSVLDDSAASV